MFDFIVFPVLQLILVLLGLYAWVVLITVALSWLSFFQIMNTRHPLVLRVSSMCAALTEPLMQPLRRLLPFVAGVDLSPLALLLLIYFFQIFVERMILKLL